MTLNDSIRAFINAVESWNRRADLVQVDGYTNEDDWLADRQSMRKSANAASEALKQLAPDMEAAGYDSTGVLTLANILDSRIVESDDIRSGQRLWRPVKAELQRLLLIRLFELH